MTRSVTTRTKFLLAAAITSGFLFASSGSALADVSGPLTYSNQTDHIVITGCDGGAAACPASVDVPATIDGLPVTRIDGGAFYGSPTLTSVTLPDSITSIGASAFFFTPLKHINVPASLVSIEAAAFAYTSVTRITIPASVNYIGAQAFQPSSVKYVTFEGDAPATLADGAFNSGASGAKAILASKSLSGYGKEGDVWNFLTITYPEFKYTIANDEVTISGYNGSGFDGVFPTDLVIPDTIEELPVTAIAADAFSAEGSSSPTSVTLPSTVTSIGDSAFQGRSSIEKVIFKGNAPTVGTDAFQGTAEGALALPWSPSLTGYGATGSEFHNLLVKLPYLTYSNWGDHIMVTGCVGGVGACPDPLVIPDTIEGLPVTEIGEYAFYKGSFAAATLPSTLKVIGGDAFEQAPNLTSIVIPEGVTTIKGAAFHKAQSLASVTLPSTLKVIEGEVFYEDSSLTGITLPAGLEQLGPGAFASTRNLTGSVTIPNGISYIGDWTFAGSAITSLTLSNTLSFIGTGAFAAIKITSLTVPPSVGYMGTDSFTGISTLTDVYFSADAPGLGARVFKNSAAGAKANLSATSLKGFGFNGDAFGVGLTVTGGLEPPPYTYTVGGSDVTITGCRATPCPASLTIPATLEDKPVKTIGNAAFQDSALTEITLPSSLTSVGNDAFSGASSLANVNFQGAAPTLGTNAFAGVAAGAKANLSSSSLTGYGYNGDLFGGLVVAGGKDRGASGGSVVTKIKFGGRSGNLTVPAGRTSVPIAFTSSQVGSFTLTVKRGSRVVKTQTGSIKLGANKILLMTKRLAASKYRVVLTLETTPPPGRRARGAVPASTKTTVTRYLTVKRAAFTG